MINLSALAPTGVTPEYSCNAAFDGSHYVIRNKRGVEVARADTLYYAQLISDILNQRPGGDT